MSLLSPGELEGREGTLRSVLWLIRFVDNVLHHTRSYNLHPSGSILVAHDPSIDSAPDGVDPAAASAFWVKRTEGTKRRNPFN
jgi:hypothetical protein